MENLESNKIGTVYNDGETTGIIVAVDKNDNPTLLMGLEDALVPDENGEGCSWYDAMKLKPENGWRVGTKEDWERVEPNWQQLVKNVKKNLKQNLMYADDRWNKWYWTSTEYSSTDAWGFYAGSSDLRYGYKVYSNKGHCVRLFKDINVKKDKMINLIDKKYLEEGNVQMTNEWISTKDALPTDFCCDCVLIHYRNNFTQCDDISLAKILKNGKWYRKLNFCKDDKNAIENDKDEIRDFNNNFTVEYWRPISGNLPKRANLKKDKRLEDVMNSTEDYKFPQELFYYVQKFYDKADYETRNIVFNALKYGYMYRNKKMTESN